MDEIIIIVILLGTLIGLCVGSAIYGKKHFNLMVNSEIYRLCSNYVDARYEENDEQAREIEEKLRKFLSTKRKVRVKTQHGFSQRGFHPGVYIQETIEDLETTPTEYAKELGVTEKELQQLISGEIETNEIMAFKLSEATGVSSQTWLNIQEEYNNYQKENK